MLGTDALSLYAWVQEQNSFLRNARIQKIQQPSRKELILTLRNNGVGKKLYINIDPVFYHVCFMSEKTEKARFIELPKQPPMFCMLLRKYLEGARINQVNLIPAERIIEFSIEKNDEFSDCSNLKLAIELMGKYSNIILYNSDTKIIIGAAHNIGEDKSRERHIVGGLPYVYPNIPHKNFIEKTDFRSFVNTIKNSGKKIHFTAAENYFFITIFFAQKIACDCIENYNSRNAFAEPELRKFYSELVRCTSCREYKPNINFEKNYYWLFDNADSCIYTEDVNEMFDVYFSQNYNNFLIQNLRKNMLAKVRKEILKLDAVNEKLLQKKTEIEQSSEYKKYADLIMANLYEDVFNNEKIKLKDFETGAVQTIKIDPSKTPVENANRYYKLYSKSKKAEEINQKFISENNNKISVLKDYIFSIENTEDYNELIEIQSEILHKPIKSSGTKSECNVPSVVVNDFVVYTGKNNRQNDYIYSKLSAPQDLWFHVLNQPGAHILVKVPKNKTVDDGTLLECATLAKNLSNARTSGKTSVIYTKRQFIKRPPNTQAGYVTFKNEKEIVVE